MASDRFVPQRRKRQFLKYARGNICALNELNDFATKFGDRKYTPGTTSHD